VAGVAALIKTIDPALSPQAIKQYIESTVDTVPALANYCVTGGRLNAYEAVAAAAYRPPYPIYVCVYMGETYGRNPGYINVNADGTFTVVPQEKTMYIRPPNEVPFYHDLDSVAIEDCLGLSLSDWGVFYSLKKNNIPSATVTCGMTFLAVISQSLYLVGVDADITITSDQAYISSVYNMQILEEIQYDACVKTRFF